MTEDSTITSPPDHHDQASAAVPPYGAAPPPARRSSRWPFVVLGVVAVLVIAMVVAREWSVNYYAISPGQAQEVAPLVKVPADQAHPIHGQILLTDVFVEQLNALSYAWNKYFEPNNDIVPSDEILGPATPANQLVDQGYLEMAQSQSAAKAAALTELGHTVPVKNVGTLVFAVQPGTEAAKALQVGQIITSANGVPTPDQCSLIVALHNMKPGQVVTLGVEQSTVNSDGVIHSGVTKPVKIPLGTVPADVGPSGCPGAPGRPTAFLGIQTNTQQQFTYPVDVSVNTQDIGGPSAGLAMTLAIIDKLSSGHLTGGHTIAATGTIDPEGDVGDVGGVPQKTIAVERAGATAFLVPDDEYKEALSKATPSLHVYKVANLSQALADLKKLGGTIPSTATPTTQAPKSA